MGCDAGSLAMRSSRQREESASKTNSLPNSVSPTPVMSFTASVTIMAPMDAHSIPKTPPSAQEGT